MPPYQPHPIWYTGFTFEDRSLLSSLSASLFMHGFLFLQFDFYRTVLETATTTTHPRKHWRKLWFVWEKEEREAQKIRRRWRTRRVQCNAATTIQSRSKWVLFQSRGKPASGFENYHLFASFGEWCDFLVTVLVAKCFWLTPKQIKLVLLDLYGN